MQNPFKSIAFSLSVFKVDQLPTESFQEVAICGKSNVGKSSLINHISESKIAKTSQTPGKTKSLNFFNVADAFYLVDLPGYGYAKTSKKEIEQFNELIESYFKMKRCSLILFLVDSRHEPTKQDMQMFEYLSYFDIPFILICTKTDKLKKNEINKLSKKMESFFGVKSEPILYSVEDKKGKTALLARIKSLGLFK